MRPPAGYVARPATWDDLDDVVELFEASDLADVGFADPTRDHIADDWRSTNVNVSRDARLYHADGALAAYAIVSGFNPELSLETFGRVHPVHRGRGLGAAIVAWTEAHALQRSPSVPVIRNAVPVTDRLAAELLEGAGYASVRTFWHMTRDLGDAVEAAPEIPGVVLRSYDHERDVRTTFDALEEAFADHWGSEPFPYDQHVREMTGVEPDLIAVAESDGVVAGVAYGAVNEGDGWLNVVGVRPAWRGRGIARALLLRVFARLAALGAPSVTLNVDAENPTGATRLYESVGMHERRAWTVFEKRFRP